MLSRFDELSVVDVLKKRKISLILTADGKRSNLAQGRNVKFYFFYFLFGSSDFSVESKVLSGKCSHLNLDPNHFEPGVNCMFVRHLPDDCDEKEGRKEGSAM